jgi:hypothetical protein
MTRQTAFLAIALLTSGIAATAGCYTAPSLTYDPAGGGAAEQPDAQPPGATDGTPSGDDGSTRKKGDGPSDAGAPGDGGAGDGSPTDGGSADGGSTRDAGPVTVTCTSATYWDTSALSSELMHPGKACIACHSATGGPAYTLAGTVYPTMHEPDDCNGTDGTITGMTVLIIDATGATHTIPVDEAGNFVRVTSIPMPYRATVISGSNVREMKTPQYDGDCNGCHSVLGTKSPGRVMAP